MAMTAKPQEKQNIIYSECEEIGVANTFTCALFHGYQQNSSKHTRCAAGRFSHTPCDLLRDQFDPGGM